MRPEVVARVLARVGRLDLRPRPAEPTASAPRLIPRAAAVLFDADTVVAQSPRRRDKSSTNVQGNLCHRALGRRPIAAAAGFDAHRVSRLEWNAISLKISFRLVHALPHHQHLPGRSSLAAADPPWGAAVPVEVDPQFAGRENSIPFPKSHPATPASGATGIIAKRQFFIPERVHRFLQLHRNDTRITVRHCAEQTGTVMVGTRSPAAVRGIVAIKERAVVARTVDTNRGIGAEMCARHAFLALPAPAP